MQLLLELLCPKLDTTSPGSPDNAFRVASPKMPFLLYFGVIGSRQKTEDTKGNTEGNTNCSWKLATGVLGASAFTLMHFTKQTCSIKETLPPLFRKSPSSKNWGGGKLLLLKFRFQEID